MFTLIALLCPCLAIVHAPQGGLEKRDITALLTRAAELAQEAGMLPADRHNDHAYVITAALQASNELVKYVDFLPVSEGACCMRRPAHAPRGWQLGLGTAGRRGPAGQCRSVRCRCAPPDRLCSAKESACSQVPCIQGCRCLAVHGMAWRGMAWQVSAPSTLCTRPTATTDPPPPTHTHTKTHKHTLAHKHTHEHALACMHARAHAHAHARTQAHTHARTHAHTHACVLTEPSPT